MLRVDEVFAVVGVQADVEYRLVQVGHVRAQCMPSRVTPCIMAIACLLPSKTAATSVVDGETICGTQWAQARIAKLADGLLARGTLSSEQIFELASRW